MSPKVIPCHLVRGLVLFAVSAVVSVTAGCAGVKTQAGGAAGGGTGGGAAARKAAVTGSGSGRGVNSGG